jgi:hypothetical protein
MSPSELYCKERAGEDQLGRLRLFIPTAGRTYSDIRQSNLSCISSLQIVTLAHQATHPAPLAQSLLQLPQPKAEDSARLILVEAVEVVHRGYDLGVAVRKRLARDHEKLERMLSRAEVRRGDGEADVRDDLRLLSDVREVALQKQMCVCVCVRVCVSKKPWSEERQEGTYVVVEDLTDGLQGLVLELGLLMAPEVGTTELNKSASSRDRAG